MLRPSCRRSSSPVASSFWGRKNVFTQSGSIADLLAMSAFGFSGPDGFGRPCRFLGAKLTWRLRARTSEFDPDCVKTFFLPQKLDATGDDPHRNAGL